MRALRAGPIASLLTLFLFQRFAACPSALPHQPHVTDITGSDMLAADYDSTTFIFSIRFSKRQKIFIASCRQVYQIYRRRFIS